VIKGQEGAITRAPNHCWGAEILRGAEWLRGRQKMPTMSLVHSSIQYICFRKASGSKMGHQTCFLPRAPSNLVTPLSIWRLVPSRNPSTHFYVAKLRCRQIADSRTALAIAMKLAFLFHFGGLQNLESVIRFPYYIPIFIAAFPFPFKAVIMH